MKCEFCGADNNERARYCGACGLSLHERCPNPKCRAGIRAHQKFCSECGAPLGTVQGSLATVQTSRQVADLILRSGERKIVTLLVADVADSTALIGGLDAEEADRILEPTLERMMKAVERYEGTIAWTAGDGIMGIFGAPIAHEDHAVRACHAALEMQEAMRSLASEVRREFGRLLQVRVGINSGPVVAKLMVQEGDVSLDYRAVGLTTHVAARLQSLAAPGAILLSRDTFALAKGFVRVGPFEQFTIKSIPDPIEVCELNGINTRMRIQARAARGLSKFVGRKDEMEMLARAAAQAQSGHGQVVALIGEAGVGKSRVFWEFTHSSAMKGWLVLDAGSVSYGKATSYLPLVDLLTRYFEIKGRDDERRVREKISGKLFALGEKKLLAQMPLFVGTLGWGDSDDTWKNLAPAERQRELFSALKNLLIRESQEQPLCVVFEDLHWVDDETQSFLDTLVESIPAARVLLLVNFRPDEYKIRWGEKSCYSQARIDPLPPASVDELLEALLGSDPELDSTKKRLVSVTQGNPLFLEEYVRSLIESGALAGSPGQWRPTGPFPAVSVPQSIEAILAARIDRLQPELKEIVQCAAVIGNDVPRALLEAVTALPQDKLERGVRELQAAEFLYEKTLFPEIEYTFKHSITREVAYSSLLKERKKTLHANVARAFLEVAAGRFEEHVERIAEHAKKGELWPMAVEYLQRAGEKAFGLYANIEASKYFADAVSALGNLPKSRPTLEQAVDLRFELRNALIALCELGAIHKCLLEVEPIVAELHDKERSARHAAFRSNHHFLAGEQRRAIEFGEVGLRLVRDGGDPRLEGELLYRIGQSYHLLGDNRQAIELLTQSIQVTVEQRERYRFELSVIPAVVNRTWLVSVLAECGDFTSCIQHAKRALEIAEDAQHPLSQVLGWLAIGHVFRRKGELNGAVQALERGMAISDRYALPMWRLRLVSSLGVAYAYSGRLAEGLQLAEQALTGAETMGLMVDQPMLHVHLGQALLLAGRIDDAIAHGQRAFEIALAHDDKGGQAWASFVIGRAHWVSGRGALDEAAMQLDSALRLAIACEARPLTAFCQTTLGNIQGRRGNKTKAQEITGAADAIYAELDMRPLPLEPMRAGSPATT
jgi:class 3 adenylate cyclase/tetratricopeptide (TPR) repeat protein